VVSFTPCVRAPGSDWIKGWMGPRAGLEAVLKLQFILRVMLEVENKSMTIKMAVHHSNSRIADRNPLAPWR